MSAEWVPLTTAVIAAAAAVFGYLSTQTKSSRERKRRLFAEAVAAVDDYSRLSRRYYTLPGDVPRNDVVLLVSEIQKAEQQIEYHDAWLSIDSPKVITSYRALVTSVKEEVGTMGESASRGVPAMHDAVTTASNFARDDSPRDECLDVMHAALAAPLPRVLGQLWANVVIPTLRQSSSRR